MFSGDITEILGIQYPIVQAPMAGGITSSRLVAAVSNAGGLGMIGAGYMTPEQIRKQIREVKSLTTKPFGINLFIPEDPDITDNGILEADELLQPYKEELKLPIRKSALTNEDHYEAQLNVVLEEGISVCSFTFGIPSAGTIGALKNKGIIVMGTATTVKEAVLNEEIGMDVVVVQGSEAGGHRGTFLEGAQGGLIGLMSLVPQVVDHVKLPVIAAGGIMDERGLMAAFHLGAKGVQMGTAFLTCDESGAHKLHKDAILHATEDQTVLTKVFSGKYARGIQNRFIQEMERFESKLPAYPYQNSLTKGIRKAAGEQNKPEFMSLWSGQSPRLSRKQTVAELIEGIMKKCHYPK